MFHHLNLSIRFPGITKNYELYTFEWYEKRGSLHVTASYMTQLVALSLGFNITRLTFPGRKLQGEITIMT